jgi:uncharacterized protein (DUF1499 family)
MGLLTRFTRNWADTDGTRDPALKPVDLPVSLTEAMPCIEAIVRNLPRWRLESVDTEAGRLMATRRTGFWGLVDDVTIRLEPSRKGTLVHAHSKSRLVLMDLGQNRRNLIEFLTLLRAQGSRWEA